MSELILGVLWIYRYADKSFLFMQVYVLLQVFRLTNVWILTERNSKTFGGESRCRSDPFSNSDRKMMKKLPRLMASYLCGSQGSALT